MHWESRQRDGTQGEPEARGAAHHETLNERSERGRAGAWRGTGQAGVHALGLGRVRRLARVECLVRGAAGSRHPAHCRGGRAGKVWDAIKLFWPLPKRSLQVRLRLRLRLRLRQGRWRCRMLWGTWRRAVRQRQAHGGKGQRRPLLAVLCCCLPELLPCRGAACPATYLLLVLPLCTIACPARCSRRQGAGCGRHSQLRRRAVAGGSAAQASWHCRQRRRHSRRSSAGSAAWHGARSAGQRFRQQLWDG